MTEGCQDFLLEVGTEELPPTALKTLSDALASAFSTRLKSSRLTFHSVETYASPRRLALLVRQLAAHQPEQEVVRRGPSLLASFSADGEPTRAAHGFARSCGVEVDDLQRERTEKGEWLLYRGRSPGRETISLIPELLEQSLSELPIPKRMRWGDGDEEFVRPVHWVCLIYGERPIEARVLGVWAGPETRGHRFHHPQPIQIKSAGDYADQLRKVGYVEPSFEKRRELIINQVNELCVSLGVVPVIDENLLDEVAALVEWPSAILGRFDEAFLEVPSEVLIETMQKHQRYFALRRHDGNLDNGFVAISNIESRDPDEVRAGNERVIRPRFADARFFWDQDRKLPLERLFPKLETVIFQDRLGSVADKSRRVERLVKIFGLNLGVPMESLGRAALLAKCDLVSTMVYEFPSLQGTMGRYYAVHSGEEACISQAMEEQYLPRFSGDALPQSACGMILGLADRLDSLVGIFGIGERPTGAKDPYALRRASIAVLRILLETSLDLDLQEALESAAGGFPAGLLKPSTVSDVLTYMFDRLPGYYQEKGIPEDRVESVLAIGETKPSRLDLRIRAVHHFRSLPAAESLAGANKRIRNLLVKSDEAGEKGLGPEVGLFQSAAEEHLWDQVQRLGEEVQPLLDDDQFERALDRLSQIQGDVDQFFEDVMVMIEDPVIRRNRLALLSQVLALFRRVADISYLR